MRVLGIETSCDETGVALYDSETGLLAHELYSQIETHQPYGGVVPELASRDHVRKLAPMVQRVLDGQAAIDGIAYTAGPGLVGALMVGASFACGLAYANRVPAIPVHHMEGHLLAPMLEEDAPDFPFLALLVSGGHTLLIDAKALGNYRILGTTLDDAAGEAFDKTAKLLGLGYPGGPAVAALAQKGDPARFAFPRPMLSKPGHDFSFSGLKTAVMLAVRAEEKKPDFGDSTKADIAASFQRAVVDTVVEKCRRAARATGHKQLIIAGGVGANTELRNTLTTQFAADGRRVHYPRPEYCTDNGAMIALAGSMRLSSTMNTARIVARARWPLDELRPPTG